jgi:DNA mismatch repair protein MutS
MRQYRSIKSSLPTGAILMFRLGDFYEMFGEDAVIASPILGATLTQRNGMPMCGVPYHALDAYLAKLIRAGKTAALCEQVEDPKTVKAGQIVRREVTRIITPGTVTEDGLLDDFSNNYIASVCEKGMALLDLSTGAFLVEEFKCEEDLRRSLERDAPVEILMPRPDTEDPAAVDIAAREKGITYTDAWTFSLDAAQEELIRHFKVTSLDGFGIQSKNDIIRAAGALLYYVHVTLRH